jgi:hypothetical protein
MNNAQQDSKRGFFFFSFSNQKMIYTKEHIPNLLFLVGFPYVSLPYHIFNSLLVCISNPMQYTMHQVHLSGSNEQALNRQRLKLITTLLQNTDLLSSLFFFFSSLSPGRRCCDLLQPPPFFPRKSRAIGYYHRRKQSDKNGITPSKMVVVLCDYTQCCYLHTGHESSSKDATTPCQ